MRSFSIDFCQIAAGVGAFLLIFGVMPFTPVAVGILIFLSMCEAKITWTTR